MSDMKTKPTEASVDAFIDAIDDERKRDDARAVAAMMADITGAPAKMWGSSIVGFGTYHYRYASGREGDFMEVGFAPRKRALTLYIMAVSRHTRSCSPSWASTPPANPAFTSSAWPMSTWPFCAN